MPFNFVSETETIARQTLPAVIVMLALGLAAIVYYFSKDKGLVYLLAGCLLLGMAGWYGYNAKRLESYPGVWEISVVEDTISWNSPNQAMDKSFTLPLSDIEQIRIETYDGELKLPTEYFLITRDRQIHLNPISGVDLNAFSEYLVDSGVEKNEVLVEKNK